VSVTLNFKSYIPIWKCNGTSPSCTKWYNVCGYFNIFIQLLHTFIITHMKWGITYTVRKSKQVIAYRLQYIKHLYCINIKVTLPAHDRVFHIFSNRTTIAKRWDKSPRSRNIFISKVNYLRSQHPQTWRGFVRRWQHIRHAKLLVGRIMKAMETSLDNTVCHDHLRVYISKKDGVLVIDFFRR